MRFLVLPVLLVLACSSSAEPTLDTASSEDAFVLTDAADPVPVADALGEDEGVSDGVANTPEATPDEGEPPVPDFSIGDADCAQSILCQLQDRCVGREGSCVYAGETDADCLPPRGEPQFSPCLGGGMCTAIMGACVPDSDDSCEASAACTDVGACSAFHGFCIPTAPAPPGSCDAPMGKVGVNQCTLLGYCTAVEGVCIAATDADCLKSSGCEDFGRCKAWRGNCGVPATDDAECKKEHGSFFKKASPCYGYGLCTAFEGVCVNASAMVTVPPSR